MRPIEGIISMRLAALALAAPLLLAVTTAQAVTIADAVIIADAVANGGIPGTVFRNSAGGAGQDEFRTVGTEETRVIGRGSAEAPFGYRIGTQTVSSTVFPAGAAGIFDTRFVRFEIENPFDFEQVFFFDIDLVAKGKAAIVDSGFSFAHAAASFRTFGFDEDVDRTFAASVAGRTAGSDMFDDFQALRLRLTVPKLSTMASGFFLTVDTEISTNIVPLPVAAPLFVATLAGLGFAARRRSA